MNRTYNKHGPDFDVGLLVIRCPRDGIDGMPRDGTEEMPRNGTERKPRDGTERKPRDGTERKPRDGTERKPRDGTKRKPRDEIVRHKDILVKRYLAKIPSQLQDILIHGQISSRWRRSGWRKPVFLRLV